jgi:hypothetical protein
MKNGPKWEPVDYAELSEGVQKTAAAFATTYERYRRLAEELSESAKRDWLAKNPKGVAGKYRSFNTSSDGVLRAGLFKKRPKLRRDFKASDRDEALPTAIAGQLQSADEPVVLKLTSEERKKAASGDIIENYRGRGGVWIVNRVYGEVTCVFSETERSSLTNITPIKIRAQDWQMLSHEQRWRALIILSKRVGLRIAKRTLREGNFGDSVHRTLAAYLPE